MSEGANTVYFVGTAGAGKSSLVGAYDRWCKKHGLGTTLVNLDPGAESLPYNPDVDVRDFIRLDEVMEEFNLGPNGAQVAAADMVAQNLTEVQEEIDSFRSEQLLIDTAGQLELFVFRQSGKYIVENLNPGSSVIAYLLDPVLARTPSGFSSQLLLAATTHFRLNEPLVHLLSKADLLPPAELERVMAWSAEPAALENDVFGEDPSMSRELAANVTRLLESMSVNSTLNPVSSLTDDGLDDLYSTIQFAIGGSEDQTPEYDTFLGPQDDDIDLDRR